MTNCRLKARITATFSPSISWRQLVKSRLAALLPILPSDICNGMRAITTVLPCSGAIRQTQALQAARMDENQ